MNSKENRPAGNRPVSAEHHHQQFNACSAKGCVWRGTCPVHGARRHPRGFSATQALMAGPSTGRRAVRVVK